MNNFNLPRIWFQTLPSLIHLDLDQGYDHSTASLMIITVIKFGDRE